jgi:hypothetical protein
VFVAHAMTADDHLRLLQEAEHLDGYEGSYAPVNGPLVDGIFCRYPRNQIIRWAKKRVTDKEVRAVRSIFIDLDTDDRERVSGISATDTEVEVVREPWEECRAWLTSKLRREPIGYGSSGNGFYMLISVQPFGPPAETTKRVADFLTTMNKRFAKPGVKIDSTVATPARLMPCPGTLKAKGINTPERPHRRTTFTCHPRIERVPLEDIC